MHTVLIIEDDSAVIQLVERMLERAGYESLAVQNLYEVEERIQEFGGISVVLADVFFPEGTSIKTVRALKKLFPRAGVVLMSGYPVEQALGDDAPMDPDWIFLQKPFSLPDLLRSIKQQLPEPELT